MVRAKLGEPENLLNPRKIGEETQETRGSYDLEKELRHYKNTPPSVGGVVMTRRDLAYLAGFHSIGNRQLH